MADSAVHRATSVSRLCSLSGKREGSCRGLTIPISTQGEFLERSSRQFNQAAAFLCFELGAFGACGYRNPSNGSFNNGGTNGNYWSSDTGGNGAWNMEFNGSNINVNSNNTGYGFSVRLFREESAFMGSALFSDIVFFDMLWIA